MSALGLGAWSWGDRSRYWYAGELNKDENLTAYKAMVDSGIDFLVRGRGGRRATRRRGRARI